jgi:hypothetical protein
MSLTWGAFRLFSQMAIGIHFHHNPVLFIDYTGIAFKKIVQNIVIEGMIGVVYSQ